MVRDEVFDSLGLLGLGLAWPAYLEAEITQGGARRQPEPVDHQKHAALVVEITLDQGANLGGLKIAALEHQHFGLPCGVGLAVEAGRIEDARGPAPAHHLWRERQPQIRGLRQQRHLALAHRRHGKVHAIVRRQRVGFARDGHLALEPASGRSLPLGLQRHDPRLAGQGDRPGDDGLLTRAHRDGCVRGGTRAGEIHAKLKKRFVTQEDTLPLGFGQGQVGGVAGPRSGKLDLDLLEEWRRGQVFLPLVGLAVAQEHDALAFAQGVGEQGLGHAKRGQVSPAAEGRLDRPYSPARVLPAVAQRDQGARLIGKLDHGDLDVLAGAGQLGDEALAILGESVCGLLAQRVVQDIDAALADHQPAGFLEIGPGECPNQQEQRQRAQQQQHHVLQTERTAPRPRAVVQEPERGKQQPVGLDAPAQVEPNRGGQRQGAHPEPRIQERERHDAT